MPRQSKPYKDDRGWRFTYRRKRYCFPTQADAWVALQRLQQADGLGERAAPLTVSGLIERWSRTHGSVHADRMADHLERFAGDKLLGEIGTDFLEAFAKDLGKRRYRKERKGRKKPYSLETTRQAVSTATRVLRWGAKRGWLTMPDAARVGKPRPSPKALTSGELAAFLGKLAANNPRALQVARMILATGARPGEIRLLEWSQVDLERRAIVLNDAKTVARTGKVRIIPLSDEAIGILAEQPRNSRWVFLTRLGRPYTREGLGSSCDRAGAGVYRLRHTWCQAQCDAGTPEEVISEIMGHESSEMIKMYRRISEARVHAAAVHAAGLATVPPRPSPQPRQRKARKRDSRNSEGRRSQIPA